MNTDYDLKLDKQISKVDVIDDKVAAVGAEHDRNQLIWLKTTMCCAGWPVTRLKPIAQRYNVKLQVADVNRRDPDDLTNIYVRGGDGEMIQLSNLVTVRESVAQQELNHSRATRSGDCPRR